MSFLAGSLVGALAASASILVPVGVLVRWLLPTWLRVVVAAVALFVAALGEIGVVTLPRVRRQARQSLAALPPSLSMFVFGLELGSGFRTHTSSLTLYTGLILALAGVEPLALLAFGAGLGLVRGIVPIDRELAASTISWDSRVSQGYWVLRSATLVAFLLAGLILQMEAVL